jgi:2-polyprenyl-3-methyl-5-hydroxy-6-metoxy-1,4-benzoquinol methylase
MTKDELYKAHQINLPNGYMPNPEGHLNNQRDRVHFYHSWDLMLQHKLDTCLDIGCWDSWLPLMLIKKGLTAEGIELIPQLCEVGRNYASLNQLSYKVTQGFWTDENVIPQNKYDLISAYEVLEHVFLDDVSTFIAKMEQYASKYITISLPNSPHTLEPQHQWTPSDSIISSLFRGKKDLNIQYQEYPSMPHVPGNWFITYLI